MVMVRKLEWRINQSSFSCAEDQWTFPPVRATQPARCSLRVSYAFIFCISHCYTSTWLLHLDHLLQSRHGPFQRNTAERSFLRSALCLIENDSVFIQLVYHLRHHPETILLVWNWCVQSRIFIHTLNILLTSFSTIKKVLRLKHYQLWSWHAYLILLSVLVEDVADFFLSHLDHLFRQIAVYDDAHVDFGHWVG